MGSNPISRSIFLLLFFTTFLFSNTVYLKKINFVNNQNIYSTDLINIDKKFLIASFNNRNIIQFSSAKIINIFKANGVAISSSSSVVFIYRLDSKKIDLIKKSIEDVYSKNIRGIDISNIVITPRSGDNLDNLELLDIQISENSFKRTDGILKAMFGVDGSVIKTINFAYNVECTQTGLVSTRKIFYGANINQFNSRLKKIKIKGRFKEFAKYEELGNIVAKVTINKNLPILSSRVKKAYDVKKGDMIKAILTESGVVIKFMLRADKNGYIGDRIPVRNANKQFYGTIIEKNLVEVE